MATTAASSTIIASSMLKRMGLMRNRPQLSQKDADALRAHQLDTIPRNGSSPVTTVEEFLERLDSATLCVAGLRASYDKEGKSDWWHMADLLDDLADLRCALRGDICQNVVQRAPVCKLVFLVEPALPDLPTQAQLIAAAQSIASMRRIRKPGGFCYTPEEMAIREAMHAELRLEKLQNLPLCGAPSIASAGLFKERMAGAVRTVAHLRELYELDGKSDWWHMADLLDDLADLLDAIRPNPRNGTQALFSVADLPYC